MAFGRSVGGAPHEAVPLRRAEPVEPVTVSTDVLDCDLVPAVTRTLYEPAPTACGRVKGFVNPKDPLPQSKGAVPRVATTAPEEALTRVTVAVVPHDTSKPDAVTVIVPPTATEEGVNVTRGPVPPVPPPSSLATTGGAATRTLCSPMSAQMN